jgi:hypothetical protein
VGIAKKQKKNLVGTEKDMENLKSKSCLKGRNKNCVPRSDAKVG